jgi:hypothetical protein
MVTGVGGKIRDSGRIFTKPYKFIGFGGPDVTKPYKFIGFGAQMSPNPINS